MKENSLNEFENIIYDISEIESENTASHLEALKIASLNLAELNQRLGGRSIKLKYTKNREWEFRPIPDGFNTKYIAKYLPIKWFLTMYRNPQFREEWIESTFPRSILDVMREESEKDKKDEAVNLFIKLFIDYNPIGILSQEEEQRFRVEMNRCCEIAKQYIKNN